MTGVEYAEEQVTVYKSCPFNCRYCWAKLPLWRYRIEKSPSPLEKAWKLANARKPRRIVLSFSSDPYCPREETEELTRQALEILLLNSNVEHTIMILTKNPELPLQRDSDILRNRNVWLGTTLTSSYPLSDEPKAPNNLQRMQALFQAHNLGVNTWVSLEPWIPNVTDPIEIIKQTHRFVDWYVIGRLDYETQFGYAKIPDGWYKPHLEKVEAFLKSHNKPYHIKKQLQENP